MMYNVFWVRQIMPANRRSGRRRPGQPDFAIDPELRRDIIAVALLVVAIITVIALFFPGGDLGSAWRGLVTRLFGWGSLLVVIALAGLGVLLLRQSFNPLFILKWQQPVGVGLLLAVFLGLLHMAAGIGGQSLLKVAESGQGGGYIGYVLSHLLGSALGPMGGLLVLLGLGVAGLVMSLDITLREIQDWLQIMRIRAMTFYQYHLRPIPPSSQKVGEPKATGTGGTITGPVPPFLRPLPPQPSPPVATPSPPGEGPSKTRQWKLPPLDILEVSPEQELSQADIRRRVKIIEDTLQSFNIQARVVEVNQGPTVTQFGVQPAPGVTVNRIVARANDLALALAAAPIRIEAPVPGKSVVGIEVPNAVASLVGLRSVMETPVFQRLKAKTKLAIALGQDVSGAPVCADLAKMPHLLIAGATGSGKTVCLNSIISCLLFNNTPDDVKFLMVDPKMVELVGFHGIPHLIAPVVTEVDKVVNVLKWAIREMDRRYKLFAAAGARNIDAFNRLPAAKRGSEHLPYIVIIIDELADIMMLAPEEAERLICRLAQMARATGIHLIIATQRPSVDVITGLIKANFPARISFAVTSQVDSRVVLDMAGAEKLLGRGDMLYMASDSAKTVRLQGTFVSDRELEALVAFWKDQAGGMIPPLPVTAAERAGMTGMGIAPDLGTVPPWEEEFGEEEDELLPQAIEVVRQAGRASVSLLQRKLRIGYARAARLIDLMEEQGIISGPIQGGRARQVLDANISQDDDG